MNASSTFYTFLQNFQDLKEAGSYRFSLNNRLPTVSHVASLPTNYQRATSSNSRQATVYHYQQKYIWYQSVNDLSVRDF